jgi:hypothetical protein
MTPTRPKPPRLTDEAKASDANEAHVCDVPGGADVVANRVNMFEAVVAEAVDVADNTEDEAKATDAEADEAKGHG